MAAAPVETTALCRCTGGARGAADAAAALATSPFIAADPTGRRYVDLFSPDAADELLTSRGLRFPQLRMVRDGTPSPRAEYTSQRSVGGASFDDLIEPARATDAFRRGATLVFQSLHTHWPPLGAFCAELSEELGHPCQANAYLSPREARGLDVHYDTHDVFALQVAGTKAWDLFVPVFPEPLGHQRWSRVRSADDPEAVEAHGDPVLSVVLRPGDSLFVPRGFVHRARTTSETSLHITVGVHARTWHAAVAKLADRAALEERFRQTVPPDVSSDDVEAFRRLLHSWLDDQDLAALLTFDPGRRRLEAAGYHRGVLVDSLVTVSDSTVVRPRHRRVDVELVDDGDDVVLRTPDRVLRLPKRARPALETIIRADSLEVVALSSHLDAASRLVVVRRLVAEGVIRVDRREGGTDGDGHGDLIP